MLKSLKALKSITSTRHSGSYCLISVIVLISGCSDAKFTGLPMIANSKGATATASSDAPGCQFINRPHPGIDPLTFDVSVNGPDVMLGSSGRTDGAPMSIGTGFGYLGALIPVAPDGRVRAEVSQDGKSGSCEQILLPLESDTSLLTSLSGDDLGGKVAFKWTWKNLYKDEAVSFDGAATLISADLKAGCLASLPLPAGPDDVFIQEFACTVEYKSDTTIKSVRYKNQKFSWQLNRVGVAGQKLQREITIDLIRNSPALPVTDSVNDPETCKPVSGATGSPFSHLCDGAQSVFGLAGGLPAACRLLGGASGQCR